MNILDRMRSMTPETLAGVRSDFDDLPTPVYVSRRPRDMVRIVEGADDLKVNRPAPKNPGMITAQDWSGDQLTDMYEDPNHDDDGCVKPCCHPGIPRVQDARSPRQIDTMAGLLDQLEELDHTVSLEARRYTAGMTEAGKWTPGREGNASDWIGRMIKKVRELRAIQESTPKPTVTGDPGADIPKGYYAVNESGAPDDIKFFRVTKFQGTTYIKIQASDEFHPIRNADYRRAVFTTIRSVGVKESQALYGQHIGRCGRCHRTLTDAVSRSRGIGPDCWDK